MQAFEADTIALAEEAEQLAALVREMPDGRRAEVVARLHAANGAAETSLAYRHPCPFLEADCCSIYADRPLYCRSHVSVNAEVCRGELAATAATVNDDSLGVERGTLASNMAWHILLNPIAAAVPSVDDASQRYSDITATNQEPVEIVDHRQQ